MPRPPSADPGGPARLIAGAAVFAAAELGIVLAFGRFFEWGRAEALLFLALRPWLLLAGAAAVARRGWRQRAGFYGLALLLAAACETLFLSRLGARAPWGEALRGLAAGALAAAALDLLVQAGMRWLGRWGRGVAAAAAALMLAAGALAPYEAIVLAEAPRRPPETKPVLLLMTALPVVWGEEGFFAPGSRPAEAYRALQEEFEVRPLDAIAPADLARGRLLLLAQPRALAASELVALDAWVRRGGAVLILADPELVWPSELPLGDVRRPPPSSLLGPLLSHWGLALEAPPGRGPLAARVEGRRVALDTPGRWRSAGPACRVGPQPWLARCLIGAGRAALVADADLMRDALWTAPGAAGAARYARTADNPLLLADLLDGLVGVERARARAAVAWADPGADRRAAFAVALLPLLLAAAAAALAARRRLR